MNKKIRTIASLMIIILIAGIGNATNFEFVLETRLTSDGNYEAVDKFNINEDVYAYGDGFKGIKKEDYPWKTLDVYIVPVKYDWADGDDITEHGVINVETFKKSDFNKNHNLMWESPLKTGKFDVIVDDNRDGIYNSTTDAVDSATSYGFEVVPELGTMTLMGLGLASMIGYIKVRKP